MTLDAAARTTLLRAAHYSIEQHLSGDNARFQCRNPDPKLRESGASFVTLKRHHALRGCIGTLDAERPLLDDVLRNARLAAFQDPRFPPLTAPELEDLHIEIAVLSATEPIRANTRSELLQALKPDEDGVIVRDGAQRATFLPSVWKILPNAGTFYDELMQKAGLGAGHWSSTLKFFRYHTQNFGDEEYI